MPSIAARPVPAARPIAFALASYAAFATADAAVKLVSDGFSTEQVAFTLALFALLPVLFLLGPGEGPRDLLPKRWGLVLLRGLLTSATMIMVWRAFTVLPLAEAYALLFVSPLLATVLAALVLKESVGWRRWSATGLGFVGVVVMIDPAFDSLSWSHLLVLAAALSAAASFVVLRKIGPSEKSAPVLFVLFSTLLIVTAPGAYANWVTPTGGELFAMAVIGLLQGSGQAGLVFATREAPASVVAPFQYTQMVWALVYGILLFNDPPTANLLAGLSLVVACGLYTAWRETVRKQPVTVAGHGEVTARAARV